MLLRISKHLRFAQALNARPYALIWVGQTLSNLGDSIFLTALAWEVLVLTGSGTSMGLVLLAGIIPRLIFTLIGGVTADRLPRKLVILWSDAGRGVVILLLALLTWMHLLTFWQLVAQSLIFGVVDGFFGPAILSITPDIVEKRDLTSANSLNSLSRNFSQLLGPALGALLITLTSTAGAFAIDALSFAISVAFLLAVRIPARKKEIVVESTGLASQLDQISNETLSSPLVKRNAIKAFFADLGEGMVYVKSSRWIWVTILISSLGNIGIVASLAVAMPKLVHDVYGQGPWLYGLINSMSAIGAFIGLIAVAQATRWKRRGLLAYLAFALANAGILILGLPFPTQSMLFIAPIAGIIFGFGLTFFNTICYTVLYEMVPTEKLGRVVSIDSLGSFGLTPIADALGGIATDHIGPALVFVIGGAFNLILILIPTLLVREIRQLE